jgi:4-carboxymuconolactone decarboxylase
MARDQTAEQERYIDEALENGVRPSEVSEVITHVAFYAGWGNGMTALPAAKAALERRRIPLSDLAPAGAELLPLDEAAEAQRAASVEQAAGPVSPGLVEFTRDVLFRDL